MKVTRILQVLSNEVLTCFSWLELSPGVLYSQLPVLPLVKKKFSFFIEQLTYLKNYFREDHIVAFLQSFNNTLNILKKLCGIYFDVRQTILMQLYRILICTKFDNGMGIWSISLKLCLLSNSQMSHHPRKFCIAPSTGRIRPSPATSPNVAAEQLPLGRHSSLPYWCPLSAHHSPLIITNSSIFNHPIGSRISIWLFTFVQYLFKE